MNNLISFQMMGGLGNILFSFSTAYALSKKYNLDLKLHYNHTGYLHTQPYKYKNNIFKNFQELKNEVNFDLINQLKFEYYEIEIPKNKNIFLNGYFQSEKNFFEFRDDLINHFSPEQEVLNNLIKKYPDINNDKTVSVHVRKGNYQQLQDFHPLLQKEYYYKSLEQFPEHKFFIFSDDIEYCYNIFKNYNCIYVKNNFDLEDLYLMSLCKNNVIANSTFSWWGAWLNQNKNKKVIAPSVWFGPEANCNSKDIIPNNWIKI